MPWHDHYSHDLILTKIRRLAGRGCSIKLTAEILGFDITPGVVAGLAKRAVPPIKFGVVVQPPPPPPEPNDGSIHHDDVRPGDKRCRYPLWKSNRPLHHEKRYCGKPVMEGRSWCPTCSKIVFEHHR